MNRTRFVFVLIIIVALLIVGISLMLRGNSQKTPRSHLRGRPASSATQL